MLFLGDCRLSCFLILSSAMTVCSGTPSPSGQPDANVEDWLLAVDDHAATLRGQGHGHGSVRTRPRDANVTSSSSSDRSRKGQSSRQPKVVNENRAPPGERGGAIGGREDAEAVDESRTTDNDELEHLVVKLGNQLRESRATQMHARSIINVMQEKQDAQERDMAILKDDLAKLKRDLAHEREQVRELKVHAADAAWAIADVKRGQDQVASDLVVLKKLQELQNETLLVIEEVIMSNALELVTHSKHGVAMRQDVARLQTQTAQDRDHLRSLYDAVQSHLATPHATNSRTWEENSIDDSDVTYGNHIRRPTHFVADELKGPDVITADPPTRHTDNDVIDKQRPKQTANVQDRMIQFNKELSQLKEQLSQLDSKVSQLLARQSTDGDSVAIGADILQTAFVNFTRQIYRLEDEWKHQMAGSSGSRPRAEQGPAGETGLKTVLDQLTVLNASLVETKSKADANRVRTETALDDLRQLRTVYETWDERSRRLEVALLNGSLEQCKRASAELAEELRTAKLSEKVTGLEAKVGEHSTAINRAESSVANAYDELNKHNEQLTLLSKQTKLFRHLPAELTLLQNDLQNIVSQFPADCSVAMIHSSSDGVYLIRPAGIGTHTARVYCERDPVDGTPWTVIQRRSDGRESFARSWDEYRTGFGDPGSEYWLGNDHISQLTVPRFQGPRSFRLRIDMWDVQGRYWVAEYPVFRIRGPDELYRLELNDVTADVTAGGNTAVGGDVSKQAGLFSGNATDALRYSDRQPFSAMDKDNDVSTTDCARFYAAGWWYRHCHYANLNGRYTSGIVWFNEVLDEWLQMKHTVMKIAPSLSPDIHSTPVTFTTKRRKTNKTIKTRPPASTPPATSLHPVTSSTIN